MAAEIFNDLPRATNANGVPVDGAKWFFYATGTTTPQAVYSDAALTTSLGAVVSADSGGQFVPVYFDATKTYRGVLKTPSGSTLRDIDPVNAGALSALSSAIGAGLIGYGALTLQDSMLDTVQKYGAVGDNVADDSAGIQAAQAAGNSFVFPKGTYKSDTAVTGALRAVSFGATFTGANAFDAQYPAFGPGALKVIARGTYNNALIGIVHNTAPAATETFPTGVTGYGRNDNAGNQVFGIYAEARQYATSGVATNEIDSFNMTATPPSSALPPLLGIGTAHNHPIGLQVGAGGVANSSIGINICQEGSMPKKFLTGIYMNASSLVNYGLFIDAEAASAYVPAVIKHGVGQTCVALIGVGTPAPNNSALIYTDGAGSEKFAIKQDGRVSFPAAITQTGRGAAGAATALPSNPTGYLKILVGGDVKVIPYYEAA